MLKVLKSETKECCSHKAQKALVEEQQLQRVLESMMLKHKRHLRGKDQESK